MTQFAVNLPFVLSLTSERAKFSICRANLCSSSKRRNCWRKRRKKRRKFIVGTIPGEFSLPSILISTARRFHRCDTVKTRASVLRFRSRFKFRRDIIYCNWKLCRTTEPRGKPTRIPPYQRSLCSRKKWKNSAGTKGIDFPSLWALGLPLSLIENDNYRDLAAWLKTREMLKFLKVSIFRIVRETDCNYGFFSAK